MALDDDGRTAAQPIMSRVRSNQLVIIVRRLAEPPTKCSLSLPEFGSLSLRDRLYGPETEEGRRRGRGGEEEKKRRGRGAEEEGMKVKGVEEIRSRMGGEHG